MVLSCSQAHKLPAKPPLPPRTNFAILSLKHQRNSARSTKHAGSMYFSPHRSKAAVASQVRARTTGLAAVEEDPAYDSLWSDSEEEEFPVNPSSSDDDDEDEASSE